MRFTKIPETAFQELQLNAGVLLSDFDPTGGMSEESMMSEIIGATSGGTNFEATPEYTDFGEDIDNCPINVKELKRLDNWTITMSGTFITVNTAMVKRLIGAGDIDSTDATRIVPRNEVDADTDFEDIWWVGDYSDKNGEYQGGYIAIHMMNSLSTGGFSLQSGNREKGTFDFEFTGHYTITDQDTVPFEVFVVAGNDEVV